MSPVKTGVDPDLEAKADALIFAVTKADFTQSGKRDVLTPWKYEDRLSREVYNGTGVAAEHVRQGVYSRPINRRQPHLNSREGVAAPLARRPGTSPLSALMAETINVASSANDARGGCTGHHGNRPTTCALGCWDSR
jgi:hypothetical protein